MKTLLISMLAVLSLLLVPVIAISGVSYADAITDGICATDPTAPGCSGAPSNAPTAEEKVNNTVKTIVDIFSWIVGVISVIMVIFGGFRYVTSGGDAGKVTSAKNTILYALVGLVIVALAQTIVFFVLDLATK